MASRQVTQPCACGSSITADASNATEVYQAVVVHNATDTHLAWRAHEISDSYHMCEGTTDTFCMAYIPSMLDKCRLCFNLQQLLDRKEEWYADQTGQGGVLAR